MNPRQPGDHAGGQSRGQNRDRPGVGNPVLHPVSRFRNWVRKLRNEQFEWARIKLTAFYLAMITAVVVILSSALYSVHSIEIRRSPEYRGDEGRLVLPRDAVREGGTPRPPGAQSNAPTSGQGSSGAVSPDTQLSFRHRLEEYVDQLLKSIILADILTIVVAGTLSYFLAGKTLRPIREAVEAEQQFFLNAAHDLKTPLTVMKTDAEITLRNRDLSLAEAREALSSSLDEVNRMSRIVEQMLFLSRTTNPIARRNTRP